MCVCVVLRACVMGEVSYNCVGATQPYPPGFEGLGGGGVPGLGEANLETIVPGAHRRPTRGGARGAGVVPGDANSLGETGEQHVSFVG